MTARGPEIASRVGIVLGISITLCFATGLLSHWIQHPPGWFWWPAHPVWLYRVTQGTHVISGVAAIPLLLVKLWAVYPRLFERPFIGSPLRMLERGSIGILVGSMIFELTTGLLNIAQYYPWKFFFPTAHYAVAYLAFGALAVHLAVKLPVIREALARPIDSSAPGRPVNIAGREQSIDTTAQDRSVDTAGRQQSVDTTAQERPVGATTVEDAPRQRVSRRAVLNAAWVGAGVAAIAVAGQTVPFLRWAAVLAPHSGQGPQGVPVNRSAAAADVVVAARDPGYRLTVRVGDHERQFTRAELLALPQRSAELPIACVEGWSASAGWSGVRLLDLLTAVAPYPGGAVQFDSLERGGLYRSSLLPQRHAVDDDTLVALALNGETLDLDHGYPCRLIAPSRPGVLQTKWLSRIEVRP